MFSNKFGTLRSTFAIFVDKYKTTDYEQQECGKASREIVDGYRGCLVEA